MTVDVKILADSITDGGSRLTTWEWTYPRMIHAEVMTHRALSKNAASSRAIPAAKLRARCLADTAVPEHWGANQKGMQASVEVEDTAAARDWWQRGFGLMHDHHAEGERLGLHKQIVNRVIEPWMHITVICSGTDWANFFHLRNHAAAEPTFQKLAASAWDLYHEHMPTYLPKGAWHLPLITDEDRHDALQEVPYHVPAYAARDVILRKVSTGRCARVSYLTHDGKRDLAEDIRLHDQLAGTANAGDPMHASPFEHPAVAVGGRVRIGNYEGWRPYRKLFVNENGPNTDDRCERCGCWAGRHVRACSSASPT